MLLFGRGTRVVTLRVATHSFMICRTKSSYSSRVPSPTDYYPLVD
jgi:hypothetical protein